MNIETIITKLQKAESKLKQAKLDLRVVREKAGREIAKARKDRRLKQVTMAKHLGLSQPGYYFIENGLAACNPERLRKIGQFLGGFK